MLVAAMMSAPRPLPSSASASASAPAAPRRPTKSLGVRKHHTATIGGARASHALSSSQNGAITSFFSKRPAAPRPPLADQTNGPLSGGGGSGQPSPSCSPADSPPVFRSLFGGGGRGELSQSSQHSQPSQPSCTPPALQTAATAAAASSGGAMWSDTPPEPAASCGGSLFSIRCAAPAAATAPAPPVKAPRKARREAAAAAESAAPSPLLMADSEDSDCRLLPFSLNLSSQASQDTPAQQMQVAPLAAAASRSRSCMSDVDAAGSQPPTRSASHCSDIVIQASQDAEEEEATDGEAIASGALTRTSALEHDEAAMLGEGRSSAPSNCSTPLLATPQQPQPQPQPLVAPPAAAIDFSAFNETITAAASASAFVHHPATAAAPVAAAPTAAAATPLPPQQFQCPDMPPPSRSPTFTSKSNSVLRASSRTGSMTYAHAAAQRSGSLLSSQSGLPPPVPRTLAAAHAPSSSQTTFHQTHLNFSRSNSGFLPPPQSLSQQDRSHSGSGPFPTFAAAAAAALSAATSIPLLSSQQLSQSQSDACNGNSLDSLSLFCTPVDQPIRERTLFEMSEELMLQREGLQVQQMQQQQQQQQYQQQLQQQQGRVAGTVNTHASLSAMGRCGSSNSGLTAPPIKKARLNQAAGPRGLESMQILGTTLPLPGEEMQTTQPTTDNLSQQMTQQQSQPLSYSVAAAQPPQRQGAPLTLDNPFITAITPAASKPSAPASSSARGSKKRGLGDSGQPSSTLLCTLPTNTSSFLLTHFEYVRQFGIGSFGFVMLVRHRLDGTLYAVKKSKSRLRGANSTRLMTREVHVMTFLKTRPHCPEAILKIIFSWQEDAHLYIQTEYCEGGSLAALLRKGAGQEGQKSGAESNGVCSLPVSHVSAPSAAAAAANGLGVVFTEDRLVDIALQMGRALAFMHLHRIVHLDVKPDNILQYAPGCYRLGDFGLACPSSDGSSSLLAVGDKRYLPAEALDECIADLTKVDMFALGCSLYELACGAPFALPMAHMEMIRIRNADIDDIAGAVSPRLYDLIRELLHPDPAQRKSAQQLVDDIEQHWMI